MQISELPGLPGEPPYPVQIALPNRSTFREGYVLKFAPLHGAIWVGNFQEGGGRYCGFLELHAEKVAVVAGGQGYVVDTVLQVNQHSFGGGDVTLLMPLEGSSDFLAIGSTDVERHSSSHRVWRSQRIGWEGLDQLQIRNDKLIGKARHLDDTWDTFEVDLISGFHIGGTY